MENIINKLKDILYEITERKFDDTDIEVSLFSGECALEPRELVYLMLFIERDFKVVFSASEINEFDFYTLKNISQAISKALEK